MEPPDTDAGVCRAAYDADGGAADTAVALVTVAPYRFVGWAILPADAPRDRLPGACLDVVGSGETAIVDLLTYRALVADGLVGGLD